MSGRVTHPSSSAFSDTFATTGEEDPKRARVKLDVYEPRHDIREPRPRKRRGCCGKCCLICKVCGLFCYIICPPIPEYITRKLAFHALKRGETYEIHGLNEEDGTVVKLSSAKKAHEMKRIWIETGPKKVRMPELFAWVQNDGMPFVVKTKRGNSLACYWYHVRGGNANTIILFAQPNSSDIGLFMQPSSMSINRLGSAFQTDIVFFDYSGFGYSTGTPCEKNVYADIEAVYDYLRDVKGENVEIILMGLSMGTAASIDLAAKNPPNVVGVILLAPFTSALRLLRNNPDDAESCCLDRFLSFEKASMIEAPTLVIHGLEDGTIPVTHGKSLQRQLKRPVPPFYAKNGDHANILSTKQTMVMHRINHFILNETTTKSKSRRDAAVDTE
ncbi:hypothetical protein QR680_003832 [Steinernema hermaphroditum]|uniref:Serine aminopeptidase S33 domain-containing protein n=1 Tax=Steinernema hermaphroditum TaxID=289476 RepID=A0AA39HMS1_9BILA|nr:hypothetical protein QR680_003832 [Steinernema hermaphroditum]